MCSWCIALVVKAVRRLPFLKSHNSDSVLLLEPFLLISLLFCGSQARLLAVVLFLFMCLMKMEENPSVLCMYYSVDTLHSAKSGESDKRRVKSN